MTRNRAMRGLTRTLGLVGLGAGLLMGNVASEAADHLDSPRTRRAGSLDLADVFIFRSPRNPRNTVLTMTMSASAGVIGPTTFQPGSLYEFKIDNNGDTIEDQTFRLGFSEANANGVQSMLLLRDQGGQVQTLASGFTGRNVPIRGGGTLRADLFDDPFFADLVAVNEFFRRVDNGLPNPIGSFLPADSGTTDRPPTNPTTPINTFGNFNCLAIVIEMPTARFQSGAGNPGFGVWARTEVFGQQVDRTAIPLVNTTLIPRLAVIPGVVLKDAFNSIPPAADRFFFRQIAINEVTRVFRFGNPTGVSDVVDLLLPDILPYDPTIPTEFPNGRTLTDDVTDVGLSILTGGALDSDRVKNDSTILNRFPYLGPPLPPPIR